MYIHITERGDMEEAKQYLDDLLSNLNGDYAEAYASICKQFQEEKDKPPEERQDIILQVKDLLEALIAYDYMLMHGYTVSSGIFTKGEQDADNSNS